MKVDLYERIFMWGVALMLALFFTSTAVAAFSRALHPPSHVETIDPTRAMSDARFRSPGLLADPTGHLHARIVGLKNVAPSLAHPFGTELTVPAATPVTFHVTSTDVVHGFEIVRTNGQTMVIPGYVSQFTTEFDEPGEYLVACNEYCGVGHHTMSGKLVVVPRERFTAPPTQAVPADWMPSATTMGGTHGGH